MDTVTKIKEYTDIKDLAEQAGFEFKDVNTNKVIYRAVCKLPGCKDSSSPDFNIYKDGCFKCYACGKGGDVINFYKYLNGVSNKEAIRQLARRLNIKNTRRAPYKAFKSNTGINTPEKHDISHSKAPGSNSREIQAKKTPADTIYRALMNLFNKALDIDSYEYLTGPERGLTDETIKHFKLFSIADYKQAKRYLLYHFDEARLKELSLINESFKRRKYFLFTKHKVIIPIIEGGKIKALRGRFLHKDGSDPDKISHNTRSYGRYRSTAGIKNSLFNGDILKDLDKGAVVYLCEAEFDTMITHQAGLNAVGVCGINLFDPGHLAARLKDYDLKILFDNEPGAQAQARKVNDEYYRLTGKPAEIQELPEGIKDATEYFIRKQQKITGVT